MTRDLETWKAQFPIFQNEGGVGSSHAVSGRDTVQERRFDTVRFMRWSKMVHAAPDAEAAAIIILNPSTPIIVLPYKHVLTLRFWDHSKLDPVDALLAKLFGRKPELCVRIRTFLRRKSGWPWRPPLAADAELVKAFISALPANIRKVDVACEFGRSRSRAVAEWIAAQNDTEAEGSRSKGRPNPRLVYLLHRLSARERADRDDRKHHADKQSGK